MLQFLSPAKAGAAFSSSLARVARAPHAYPGLLH